jgi:hypothetical protein
MGRFAIADLQGRGKRSDAGRPRGKIRPECNPSRYLPQSFPPQWERADRNVSSGRWTGGGRRDVEGAAGLRRGTSVLATCPARNQGCSPKLTQEASGGRYWGRTTDWNRLRIRSLRGTADATDGHFVRGMQKGRRRARWNELCPLGSFF